MYMSRKVCEWEGGNPSVEQYWEGIHDSLLDERVKESARGMRKCKIDGETKQVHIDDYSEPCDDLNWKLNGLK